MLRVTKKPQPSANLREGLGSNPPPLLIAGDPGSGRKPRYWIPDDSRVAPPFRVNLGFPAMQKNLELGMREADAKDPGTPTPCAPPTTPPSRSAEDTCGVAAPASPARSPGRVTVSPGWRSLDALTTRGEHHRLQETVRNLCCLRRGCTETLCPEPRKQPVLRSMT